jgi:hypothetical protein
MSTHPIYRVRRLALAARLAAGDALEPHDWRRAALEPFDDRVPFEALERSATAPDGSARLACAKIKPGPQF